MVNVYKIGSFVSDSPTGIKALNAGVTTVAYYDTFKEAVTAYSVPAGKVFYITRLTYTGKYNAGIIEIGYGDTSVSDSAAAPTNYVSLTASATPYRTEAHLPKQFSCFFNIPANKYPCLRVSGAADGQAIVEGVEI